MAEAGNKLLVPRCFSRQGSHSSFTVVGDGAAALTVLLKVQKAIVTCSLHLIKSSQLPRRVRLSPES